MTYSITSTDTHVTGNFIYMVKISDTRWERYIFQEEKTLEEITPLIDDLLAKEKELEDIKTQKKIDEEANLK